MRSYIDQLREDLSRGDTNVPPERVARLLELVECLARRYAALSDFVSVFPAIVHPGQHSAREIETDPDSRAFFSLLSEMIQAKQVYAQQEGQRMRFRCQCCGLPTLLEDPATRQFEICSICNWEQESVADPDVAEGGPNGAMSLTEARQNFERRFTMYENGDVCSI
jgi:hypothetical protein